MMETTSTNTRTKRRQPWVGKTFGVFLFGTLCVSSSQFFVSVVNPTTPPSPDERLQSSKETFRGTASDTAVSSLPLLPVKQIFNEIVETQRIQPASDAPAERPDYHVVFSTSCSKQQNWESYVFFFHALKVKQPGNITRIVSACNDKQQDHLQKFFDQHIRPMRPDNR